MTRYVLAGGSDRAYDAYGPRLNSAIRDTKPGPLKVVSCLFSQEKDIWTEKFQDWKSWFLKNLGEDTEIQLADPDLFLEQVRWADVIYLHGGRTKNLEDAMGPYQDLEKYFEGKVIIGSSAGTNFLSKTYFSPKQNSVGAGRGIIPLNTIVHYGAESDGEVSLTKDEWKAVIERVRERVGDEPIMLLSEGEFIIVDK